jgi:hypothetical protein
VKLTKRATKRLEGNSIDAECGTDESVNKIGDRMPPEKCAVHIMMILMAKKSICVSVAAAHTLYTCSARQSTTTAKKTTDVHTSSISPQ